MKKSILIGVSIVTVLGILLAAAALGFADSKTKFNAFKSAEVNEQVKEKVQEAQAKVSFKILEPSYIPEHLHKAEKRLIGHIIEQMS